MSRNKLYATILVVVILIASISFVYLTNNSGQSDNPENGLTQNTVTVVDLANRTVTLEVPVETVVLGSPELVNAFAAVDGDDFVSHIVGMGSMFKLMYLDLYEIYASEYPEFADIAQLGSCYDGSFSVETIVSLNPDVLILPLWAITMDMTPDLSALDAAGIPYIFLDFYVDPYDGYSYTQSVSVIGTILGEEERAANIVDFYDEQLDAVFVVLDSLDSSYPVPTVYLEYPDAGTSNYGTTLVDMGMAMPLNYARGYNIAKDAVGGYGGTINGEFLLDANPDVIMFCVARTLSTSGGDLVGFGAYPSTEEVQAVISAYFERDGWDTLDAVKNKKVYFWCSEVGFSINSFSALQYMAKLLYPDLFTTLDPLQNLQEFYNKFMPIPLEGTWTFSSDFEQSGDSGDVTPTTATVVDLANRAVTLELPVETAILMDSEALNAFVAVVGEDFTDHILGWSSNYPTDHADLYQAYLTEYPEVADITNMGDLYYQTFSAETVITLNPDVLILPLWAKVGGLEPDWSALDAAGIPYVYTDLYLDPYNGSYTQSVSLLGTLFGEEERANDINDFYNQQLDTVFDVLDTLDESYPKSTVYNEIPYEGPSSYGPTYVDGLCVTAAIDYARGYNIATDPLSNATISGYISPEFLLDANPDIIVFWMYAGLDSSAGGGTTGYGVYPSTEAVQSVVSAFLARDGWDTLNAVKNGKVYFCNAEIALGIENFGLLQYMAKWFYPDLFSSLDPLANLQDFYTQFIPIPLDGTWTFSRDFEQSGDSGNITPTTATVVDLANRTVTLEIPVEKVVLMDAEAINVFAAVGGEDFVTHLVGLSSSLPQATPDLYDAYRNVYPEFTDIPFVGAFYDASFNIEAVVSLDPDVLIIPFYVKAFDMEPDWSALDAAGIPYVYTDFLMQPYEEDFVQSVSLLGTILGEDERAANIVDFYNEQLNTVFDVVNNIDESYPVPTVYNEYPSSGPSSYGVTYVQQGAAYAIEYARGINIATGTVVGKGTISSEFLIAENPDVIVFWMDPTLAPSFGGGTTGFGAFPSTEELQPIVSTYIERDGWDTLNAVKNGKVYFWYSGFVHSIENFAMLQDLAKLMYPDLFDSLDPLQNLQDFYTQFMPIPLDGTWGYSSGDILG